KRIELQIVMLGGSATALSVMILMLVRNLTGIQGLSRIYPFIVLVFYTGTVVAITTSRVFNARQILIVGLQNFILVTVVAALAYGLDRLISGLISGVLVDDASWVLNAVSWVLTIGVALWLSAALKTWLDRVFEFYPQGKMARQAAFAVAQRERTVEKLEEAFHSLLAGWGHSERALILSGNKQSLGSGKLQLDGDGAVMRTMRELRWATPERLARERSTPEREALGKFLREQQLGVLVIEEGLTLTSLVGVGLTASRRPFTYPQVTQLTELASIVESALERAHFSAKVQHTEQLATVGVLGASLAHEIRNPLVSIKTFVQLLPTHYNDPAFRDKFFRLIGDEVTRIDQLTDQLLDLSAPRAYMAHLIDLHPFLLSGLDLVAAKASHRQVQLQTDFQASPDRAFTDPSAAKQVMLNLCFNAIQAVEACDESARWVKLSTRNVGDRIEMAVSDGGPGISPEIRPKLFQPFQTTKSSGFGLGLAVCSDILANLQASISVDPPEAGRGATFRVTFPCQPSSS
ncbi:MAG: ATP-binding protein, partial [Opitutaceae bacterium]